MRPLRVMAALLLTGPLLLSGCGKKTPPVPPESAVPAQVADLTGVLDPQGITLRWSWPRKTEKGAGLRRVNEFIVERAEDRVADYCGDCPLRYQPLATLPGGALPDQPSAATLTFRDESLRPGYHYAYRVRSSLGWRVISAPSTPFGLVWQVALAAPTGLAGNNGDREVTLTWQPPGRDREGGELAEPLRYQVERSEAGQPFRLVIGELSGPTFTDQGLKSGATYQYRVRASRASGGTGEYSAPLTVTLRDQTPPPPPFGLSAVVTGDSVRLFWELPSNEELGGTMIYRRRPAAEGNDFELIGQVSGRTASFVDPLPLAATGEARRYALKTYDRAEPANVSEFSREAQTPAQKSRP